jgi:Fic family protein
MKENKLTNKKINEFLRESNAIEGVYDKQSLVNARKAWDKLMSFDTLNLARVMTIHRILMEGKMDEQYVGKFRKTPVFIGGHPAMNYQKIVGEMKHWIKYMNLRLQTSEGPWGITKKDLKARTRQLHVLFEQIHPFLDGNGRTGRMFMNWQRIKDNLPILIIHTGKEQKEYYTWFRSQREIDEQRKRDLYDNLNSDEQERQELLRPRERFYNPHSYSFSREREIDQIYFSEMIRGSWNLATPNLVTPTVSVEETIPIEQVGVVMSEGTEPEPLTFSNSTNLEGTTFIEPNNSHLYNY